MRRMIPIATTVAVLASTAVSATQRSMQMPAESAGRPGFAPPVMFTPPADNQPRANWNEERKAAPVAAETPAAVEPAKVESAKVQPAAPAEAAKEKGAPPERNTLTRSSSSHSPQRGKVPAQTEPSLSDKGDTTAPVASAEIRKSAPSSVPAGLSAASPAAAPTASMQGKHAGSEAVPAPEARSDKKVRDVVAVPAPDAQTVERARTLLDESAVGDRAEGKGEPRKDVAGDAPKDGAKQPTRESKELKVPAPKPHFVGQQGRAKPVALASLRGEDGGTGDRLVLTRQFGAWSLKCDMLISRNERICAIEQALRANEADAFTWRLATSAAGKPLVVFEFTDRAEADKGLGISIAGFDKTIPATEWACADGRCSATMPIVGPVSSWFTNTSQIQFRYDRGAESVKISAAMSGFESAVAALQNPLGLKTQVAGAPSTTVAKTAEAN